MTCTELLLHIGMGAIGGLCFIVLLKLFIWLRRP